MVPYNRLWHASGPRCMDDVAGIEFCLVEGFVICIRLTWGVTQKLLQFGQANSLQVVLLQYTGHGKSSCVEEDHTVCLLDQLCVCS